MGVGAARLLSVRFRGPIPARPWFWFRAGGRARTLDWRLSRTRASWHPDVKAGRFSAACTARSKPRKCSAWTRAPIGRPAARDATTEDN
jgi:hypothetical protein